MVYVSFSNRNKARREPVRFTIAQDEDDDASPRISIEPPSIEPSSPPNDVSHL